MWRGRGIASQGGRAKATSGRKKNDGVHEYPTAVLRLPADPTAVNEWRVKVRKKEHAVAVGIACSTLDPGRVFGREMSRGLAWWLTPEGDVCDGDKVVHKRCADLAYSVGDTVVVTLSRTTVSFSVNGLEASTLVEIKDAASRSLHLCAQMLSKGDEAELEGMLQDAVMHGTLEKKSASDPLGRYRPRVFTLTTTELSYPGADRGRMTVRDSDQKLGIREVLASAVSFIGADHACSSEVLPCRGLREISCPRDSQTGLVIKHTARSLTLRAPTSHIRDAWAEAFRHVASLLMPAGETGDAGSVHPASVKISLEGQTRAPASLSPPSSPPEGYESGGGVYALSRFVRGKGPPMRSVGTDVSLRSEGALGQSAWATPKGGESLKAGSDAASRYAEDEIVDFNEESITETSRDLTVLKCDNGTGT